MFLDVDGCLWILIKKFIALSTLVFPRASKVGRKDMGAMGKLGVKG